MQAFDDLRLTRLFQRLNGLDNAGQPLHFRQSDHGEYVLPPVPMSDPTNLSTSVSPFLKHVAAYSQGILGIARGLWRNALRTGIPEAEARDKVLQGSSSDTGNTIWVLPWDNLTFPTIPDKRTPGHTHVLHAVLLHGTLPYNLMAELLPYSSGEILSILMSLKDARLMNASQEGVWSVTPDGYPAVRQFLHGEGYMTDSF